MAITSSAQKAIRVAKRKRVFNVRRKNAIDQNFKAFRKFISEKNKVEAQKLLPNIYKSLDKAAKTGYIKPNTAARLKSRATITFNKLA